jgi:sarcosine oxidase / L-pipecolate oxidase
MTSREPPADKDESLLIIGAGVFGLSLALELKQERGYKNITVIDRYMPPAVDGSSVDISRVIRVEYADELYARMAGEALKGWKGQQYREHFHQSGFVILYDKAEEGHFGGRYYAEKTLEVSKALGVLTRKEQAKL